MSPQSFGDIVPPERRSIRNISPSHARARAVRPYEGEPTPEESTAPRTPRKRKRGRLGFSIVLLALLLVAVAGFSLLFAGSRVIVTPKQKAVAVEGVFEAVREAQAPGVLGFQVMTYSKSSSKAVSATGEEQVDESASGTIVVYNDYSSAEQRLIKNTRFETSAGQIFRIADSITVPGQSVVDGKTVPGSVEVIVYADKPGAEYNIGLSDFKIPGFTDDPRYEKFYGRSKTPMQGGFSGMRPAVADADLATVTAELKTEIEASIRDEALAQRPEGFYLFKDMMFVDFDEVTLASKDDSVEATLTGTLHGILFSESTFASFLATQTVAGYDEEPVHLQDSSTVSVALEEKDGVIPTWNSEKLMLAINGTADLVWSYDEAQLKTDLAGRDKEALTTILSGYPAIETAEVVLRPFWKQSFPESPEDIAIETQLSQ